MAKREFLMLAHTYKSSKHGVAGWYMSEKLDGQRCFWDGGITRGMKKADVPWANTDKDDRYVEEQISTGLWSRYGNVIHAPDDFLDQIPPMPLDGELWCEDYRPRQDIMRIIKDIIPGPGWKDIKFMVYGVPPLYGIFEDGEINNTNYQKVFKGIMRWVATQWSIEGDDNYFCAMTGPNSPFKNHYFFMKKHIDPENPYVKVLPQMELAQYPPKAKEQMDEYQEEVLAKGGEGLIVRDPFKPWVPARSHSMLKVKKWDDAEGTVVGYITGRETDKGSKLLGMMGALILEIDGGKRLELSGFTNEERTLRMIDPYKGDETAGQVDAYAWAASCPENECLDCIEAKHFPRGTRVSYKYRGLSKDGIPQEARYWRKDERI